MKPDICIYHGNCADGFGAAWAVWRRWGDAVQFVPGVYGKEPPDVTGKHVLMVDFSYKRPVLETMARGSRSITVLDHHKTAQADLEPFIDDVPMPWNFEEFASACAMQGQLPIRAQFDMEKSGAVLAWEFCFSARPVPRLLLYIQDRDLWKFELGFSREIAACLFSHPYDFAKWSEIIEAAETSELQGMIEQGAAIERKHHKDIAELVAVTKRRMVIGGFSVPVANLPYTLTSDAGNLMAVDGEQFAACYWDTPTGRIFSLRSRVNGADVSEIAKSYGGGGHKNAAGFQMPLGWEGDPA